METYVLIVTIYDKRKEYVLPQKRNADYEIGLRKSFFQTLPRDILLKLEVLDGIWRLQKNEDFYLPEGDEYFQEIRDYEEKGYIELKKSSGQEREGERYSNGRRSLVLCPSQGKNMILELKGYQDLFRPYQKYQISGLKEIVISSDRRQADIYWNAWSGWDVKLTWDETGFAAACEHPKGFFRNGAIVPQKDGAQRLEFGDLLDLWGLHLIYLGNEIAVEEPLAQHYFEIREGGKLKLAVQENEKPKESEPLEGSREKKYVRSVREQLGSSVLPQEIVLAKPKERMEEEARPLLMTIGPSFTMMIPMAMGCILMFSASNGSGGQMSMFRVIGLCTSALSALIGMAWTLAGLRYQKEKRRKEQTKWNQIHAAYFKEQYEELGKQYETAAGELRDLYPAADSCMEMEFLGGAEQVGVLRTERICHHLWERNKTHDDFLKHRIGTGELPFQIHVQFEKLEKPDYDAGKHSHTYEDYREAAERAKYKNLKDVPILLDLKNNPLIGIVGGKGEKSGAVAFAKALSAQIAAWNCYTEVKMAYIYDDATSDDSGSWEFVKWLPHVWSKDKICRYVASGQKEAKDVFYALSNVFRSRMEDGAGRGQKSLQQLPHYIVFLSDPSFLYGEMFAKYAFEKEISLGLTTIVLTDQKNRLPNECTYIVEISNGHEGECVDMARNTAQSLKFSPDGADGGRLEMFSRALSRIQVAETEEGGEIPESLTFFELYGVKKPEELKAEERWKKNKPYDHLEGMLGQMAGGKPCILDLHEKMHGPHGLVGGTTGSGKSETLQSYLLSLAVNYSPNDVAYFLIDYKGEGMAGLFERLPHKIGQMSNLSANQAERIMISIRMENMRREQIFSENGVKNINEYRKLWEESEEIQASLPILPHLFIVIDEFAQLKKENPAFIDQLISVSQVGRSLGVHLILATQTPGGGTVSGNIVSNAKFKICLRMQSKDDSAAMIGKKDAAYITQAGRGYLQVGMDELYEQFQSGYSGAAYFGEQGSQEKSKVLLVEGKPALVRTEGNVVRHRQKESMEQSWILQMLRCIQEIAKETELSQVFSDNAVRERFLTRFYECLNGNGYAFRPREEDDEPLKPDYERNEYTDQRILHLLDDYRSCCQECGELSLECQAERLLLHSDRKYPEKKKETQLSATIDYLAKIAAKDPAYQTVYRIAKPLLKEKIYLDESKFSAYTKEFFREESGWEKTGEEIARKAVAGYIDDPASLQDSQKQRPFVVDFVREGNTAIYGCGGAGKSTLLQTLLYGLISRYRPDEVRIFAVDFDKNALAYFKDAPHIEQLIERGQMDKFWEMLGTVAQELELRRKKYAGHDYRNYLQSRKSNPDKEGEHLASIFIFLDNFAEVAGQMQQLGQLAQASLLERIVKESAGMGIYFVITGSGVSGKEIPFNVAQWMSKHICLEMEGETKYEQALHVSRLWIYPEKDVKGRGLAVCEKGRVLEFQSVLAVRPKSGKPRERLIEERCQMMRRVWNGQELPVVGKRLSAVDAGKFFEDGNVQQKIQSPYEFPIGYGEDGEICALSLPETNCFGICRYAEDGAGAGFLETCVQIAMKKQAYIILVDQGTEWSGQFAGYEKAAVISDERSLWELMQDDSGLWKAFQGRNKKKTELFGTAPAQGKVLFDALQKEEPYYIFIKNMPWFIVSILRPQQDTYVFHRWVYLWGKGKQHHIYTFAEFVQDAKEAVSLRFYSNTKRDYQKTLKECKLPQDMAWPVSVFFEHNMGIHLGGNIARAAKSGFKYQFDGMSQTAKKKTEASQIGYLTDGGQTVRRVEVSGR